ncbi:MAG TPA: hypothetical protein VFY18_05115 [Candidatus Limnocylindrales bacterium]|nr:hypothetical protein [Candidatus Limnocylindrales bacterium]
MRRGVIAGALLLVAACGGPTPRSDASPSLATFHERGLVFAYPAPWRSFRYQVVSSFSNAIVYLATVDVPDPCTRTANSVACGQHFRLEPNSIVVSINGVGFPGFNILEGQPPGSTGLVVGGLPAYVERLPSEEAAAGADLSMRWTIARPGSVDNFFTIQADIRGPDVAGRLNQVETLVAGLQFDPPLVPLDTSDAGAERAATKALAVMSATDPSWACFPGKPGMRTVLVTAMASGPVLATPQIATCSTRMEATRLQLWRLTLTERLPEADPQAGTAIQIVLWVSPDGTPGQMTSGSPEP